MRLLTAFFLCMAAAAAQQVGQNTTPGGTGAATFTSSTQLVVETVVVTDKSGSPVEDLTAKDFTITENGVPQVIRLFEHQNLPEITGTPPMVRSGPENIHVFDKLGRVHISREVNGTLQYKDRRLLALYFDMTAMQQADQLRALAAAKTFVRTQMQASDLLAIMRYSGGAVDVLQDFTDDRDRLLSIIQTLIVGEGEGFDESTSDASSSDTGAAFGQDDSEFNIFNTDRQLSALQTAATMLGQLNEKKSLIYFAGGLRMNGLNNQAQLRATINAAIRAGVSFWPIDARGLVAQAPLGDATKGSPGGIDMYTGNSALAVTTNFQQSQDSLYALASD
ncbi:MAG TPA: VWA domain-containing protein, partial [Bryobacteraceae bacterium]|nr:VWA domain-containing protein [Bryobacteraceae bacterium]